jgi:predicted nucleic acid-binding protein
LKGICLDTGALIHLVEKRALSMRKVFDTAATARVPMHVSTAVIAEWWREGRGEKDRARWLRSMCIESVTEPIGRLAGVAMGRLGSGNTIDAIVLATAALRGDSVVYTSDLKDLEALREGVAEFAHLQIEHA